MPGGKSIDLVGSIALLINNVLGAGPVLFPALFQQAGWLLCLLSLGAVSLEHYFGRQGLTYAITQFIFQFMLLTICMSTIIQSVQALDYMLVDIFGRSCALELSPLPGFVCDDRDGISPFKDLYVISAGYVICACVCIPLGTLNLDENINLQKVAAITIFACTVTWLSLSIFFGLHSGRVPAIGTDVSQLLGVTMFNFQLCITLPSWLNEKRPDTSVTKSLTWTLVICVTIFVLMGFICGMGFQPYYSSPNSLLQEMRNHDSDRVQDLIPLISIYLYPIAANWTSIPKGSLQDGIDLAASLQRGLIGACTDHAVEVHHLL
ncbi:hypothetical protein CYMTET_55692 [Cymbomonas tetramitiformis]|uniref:Amino acid transporter transmembrane domain-containing protein n=1 Tax=Cymbomonas tetramitiformis TaxID=36881 RepID=A0AAE0BCS3_9CHLO|nr:hypothetical protein CYMTET_55692 [Cymbomonas tetramitiformis]